MTLPQFHPTFPLLYLANTCSSRTQQAELNNTFTLREKNLLTGLYAFNKYTSGSAYWTAKFLGTAKVDGEGTQQDYWNYGTFVDLGYTKNVGRGAVYCV